MVARSKGQKNVYRRRKSAWTWPGAYSLSKSVHTPLLLVQLAPNALQCMQDCPRGILFNDRLIYICIPLLSACVYSFYIYKNYRRTLTVTVYCKRFEEPKRRLWSSFKQIGGCHCSMYLVIPFLNYSDV